MWFCQRLGKMNSSQKVCPETSTSSGFRGGRPSSVRLDTYTRKRSGSSQRVTGPSTTVRFPRPMVLWWTKGRWMGSNWFSITRE